MRMCQHGMDVEQEYCYHCEHPMQAAVPFVSKLRCCAKKNERHKCGLTVEMGLMMNGQMYPMCRKCCYRATSTIDKLNLKYAGKTEYSAVVWDVEMEAKYGNKAKF